MEDRDIAGISTWKHFLPWEDTHGEVTVVPLACVGMSAFPSTRLLGEVTQPPHS